MKRDNQKEQKHKLNGGAPGDDDLLVQKSIAMRAYELYVRRGGVDGHAEQDWLQAEEEILKEMLH